MSAEMKRMRDPWTEDRLTQIAKRYSTRSEFAKNDQSAYQAARRKGVGFFIKICAHMDKEMMDAIQRIHSVPNKSKNQKIIPHNETKRSIVEFLTEETSTGKYATKIHQYHVKNNQQIKLINQSHNNFISIMGDKMSSTELTFVRFKDIVDNSVKAMQDKNNQILNLLKTIVMMDNAKFSDDAIYEKNFKLLDDNFSENEKNIAIIFDITLKLSQMKNKDSFVEHKYAMDDLGELQKNIDKYIK